jgi:hypothetical protein
VLTPLPDRPDHNRLELDVLEFWAGADIFARVRERSETGPGFSFLDGPVTANKSLGVHTAWSRTLKDVFQRYRAQQGYRLRYQNRITLTLPATDAGLESYLPMIARETLAVDVAFARPRGGLPAGQGHDLTRPALRHRQW